MPVLTLALSLLIASSLTTAGQAQPIPYGVPGAPPYSYYPGYYYPDYAYYPSYYYGYPAPPYYYGPSIGAYYGGGWDAWDGGWYGGSGGGWHPP
jgi:hypothetical protein